MSYAVWGLAALVVAGAVTVVVTYLTMRRGVHYQRAYRYRGVDRVLQLHFNHWFPRWRRSFDFTHGGHIWFRDSAPDNWQRASGVGSANTHKVQREMVAHAVRHDIQRIDEGDLRYTVVGFFEQLTQWVWRRRAHEEEARRSENAIRQGTYQFLDPIPWLDDFPNDWQGSAA